MNNTSISDKYERTLEDFKQMSSARVRRQVRNVLELISLSQDEKVIEIGVATGKFTSIVSRNNRIFTLDLSFDNLQRARRAVGELGDARNQFSVNGDCAHIPFADHTFDKIMAIDIIEHLTDDVFHLFCEEAYRIAKTGASLYIYTPNLLHPYELARPFRPLLRSEHIGVRTMRTICASLKKAGFKIKRSYFNNLFRRISIEAVKRA